MNTESNKNLSISELLQILADAENDVTNNKIAFVQETFDNIRDALKEKYS